MKMSDFSANLERWKEPALWTLSSILATVFIVAGSAKLLAIDAMASSFSHWGYSTRAMIAIGIIEIANASLLLSRKYAFFGALALGLVMVGAHVTHVAHGELALALVPVVLLATLGVVALARLPEDLRQWWHARRDGSLWRAQGI